MCLAILDTEKTTLIENNFGFTEILKVGVAFMYLKLVETRELFQVCSHRKFWFYLHFIVIL